MRNVLLTWELGEGYGHLAVLRRIVRRLLPHDCTVTLAVRDVVRTQSFFDNIPVTILQAPIIRPSYLKTANMEVAGYADILAVHGFGEFESLSALVSAWRNLLALVKPDIIIADHSPVACLAAFDEIPVVTVGNGFTSPPATLNEFPLIRSELAEITPQSQLLQNINRVQKSSGKKEADTITEPFRSVKEYVFCYPELDPYRGVREGAVRGPVDIMPLPVPVTFDANLFVYCSAAYSGIQNLYLGLASLKMPISIFMRGKSTSLTRFLQARGIRVYKSPPPLSEVIPKASVVLSHAGAGLSHAAYAAGRAQILLPRHLESRLTALALKNSGVATVIDKLTKRALDWAVDHTCEDLKKRDLAYKRACSVRDAGYVDSIPELIEECLQIMH